MQRDCQIKMSLKNTIMIFHRKSGNADVPEPMGELQLRLLPQVTLFWESTFYSINLKYGKSSNLPYCMRQMDVGPPLVCGGGWKDDHGSNCGSINMAPTGHRRLPLCTYCVQNVQFMFIYLTSSKHQVESTACRRNISPHKIWRRQLLPCSNGSNQKE